MAFAEATLAARGHRPVSLWVLEGNARARRFCEKNGFAPDGARKEAFPGTGIMEVRYRRPLTV